MGTDKFLSPREAADRLSVSIESIYRYLRLGQIDGYKPSGNDLGNWRIKESDLERYIESRRVNVQRSEAV